MSQCAWRVVCLVSPCACKPKETAAGRTIIRHASLSIPGSISTLAVVGATSSGLPSCKSLTGSGGADQLVVCGVRDGQGLACQHRFVDRAAALGHADAVTPAVSTRLPRRERRGTSHLQLVQRDRDIDDLHGTKTAEIGRAHV